MEVINVDLAKSVFRGDSVKFIMNQQALFFFSPSQQHRDMKIQGLSYEDDYKGNAVAGILSSSKVEIRFHAAFSDERIRTIWATVRRMPGLEPLWNGKLLYQGRLLS